LQAIEKAHLQAIGGGNTERVGPTSFPFALLGTLPKPQAHVLPVVHPPLKSLKPAHDLLINA
jgi:hypothetical protein